MRHILLGLIFISLFACNHKIDNESARLSKLALDTVKSQSNSNDTLDSIKIHRLIIANLLLDSAIKIDSKNINAYFWKSTFQITLKDYSSAIKTCDIGLENSNEQKNYIIASLHVQRGLLNLRLNTKDLNNDFSVALDWFDTQIEKDDSNLDAIMNKAIILCYMDKKDKAIEYLTSIHIDKIKTRINDLIAQIKDFKIENVINK